jgi:glycerol kinase
MPRSTKKAHVVRAALEAIAYQIKDLIDLMAQGSGVGLKELRVDGGPTRNNFLMQFQTDMLDSAVVRTDVEEVSALGSALMAGLTVGVWKDFDALSSLRKVDKTFGSSMDAGTRDQHYKGWQEAVKKVLTK